MTTLRDLIKQHGATGYIYADHGNGSSTSPNGHFVYCDIGDDLSDKIYDLEMQEISYNHVSDDDVECHYMSNMVDLGDYSYRVYF